MILEFPWCALDLSMLKKKKKTFLTSFPIFRRFHISSLIQVAQLPLPPSAGLVILKMKQLTLTYLNLIG